MHWREGLDHHGPAMVVDTCRVPTLGVATGDAEVVQVGGNEVARVVDVLEANEVHVEEASEEIIADKDNIEALGGGEQRVEEGPDVGACPTCD